MLLTLSPLLLDILAFLTTLLISCYTFFKWRYKYWERKGVPYAEPKFPFGSMRNPFWKPVYSGEQYANIYSTFKAKGHKHVGSYSLASPKYIPLDIQLVKNIIKTDFDYFVDRGMFYNEKDDPLTGNLFSIEGTKWRNIRMKLTPTFTSGKMKMMLPTFLQLGNQLKDALDNIIAKSEPIDIKDIVARFTTNVIGSCAFGIECNCFEDNDSDFIKYGKKVFLSEGFNKIKVVFGFSNPDLARRLRIKFYPDDVINFFMKIIKETVIYREDNNVTRKDLMQLLIDIKNNTKGEQGSANGLTLEELAGQAFGFFIGGYETTATTMTFCLFELASNLDIQQNVRNEIEKVLNKCNGEINYDALSEMKYMGQVIDETLRKYPPLPFLYRKCVRPYRVPDTDVVLEKGTAVRIPVLGIHHDPEYFPDPEKFDPDRFSEENKNNIIPFTYLPFGGGPRICMGTRFAIMQTKMGLTILLRNYKFSLNNKTEVPIKMDPFSLLMSVKGDVWLNAEPAK